MPNGQFPTIPAGVTYVASLIQSLALPFARKDVDATARTGTTLTADSDLLIAMAANGHYIFAGVLFATGAAIGTGDLAVAFTWPAGAACSWSGWGLAQQTGTASASANAARATSGASLAFGVAGGTLTPVWFAGSCQNGAAAGSLQLEAAEAATNATGTVLKARSCLLSLRTV